MALPDVLRLCDAFELRPCLLSTNEILDAFSSVVLPGVLDLTDEGVGNCKQLSAHIADLQHRPAEETAEVEEVSKFPSSKSVGVESEGSRRHDTTRYNAASDAVNPSKACKEDDKCSVYSRPDLEGETPVKSAYRQTSPTSSAIGSKGKRNVYIGRAQRFPLRSADSRLSTSNDLTVGISGASSHSDLGEMFRVSCCGVKFLFET